MQVLLVSDLHYTLKQLDWVVNVAGEFDLVVVAGDLLDVASIVEPDAQIAVVTEYLARMAAKATVVACSGNHDLDGENAYGERAARWLDRARNTGVYVDGDTIETDNEVITVCAWWDGPQTRDDVDRQFAADAARVGERSWIWVYHAPPDESPTSWTGKRHYGDDALNAWITRHNPALVLCGHVHQSPFVADGGWIDRIGSTVVLNAGRQRGPRPTAIELDTVTGEARWFSVDGVEERSLATA